MQNDYRHFIATLSTKPGIYQMIDAKKRVIYVGKARNLQKRVAQYFHKNLSHKNRVMMQQVHHIETIMTQHENEALLLEANLIKKWKPKYNILLRDDKSYPYLYLSLEHPFPRLDLHRGSTQKPGRYFGPYPNAKSIRESLNLIQKLFKLRQCNDVFFSNRTRPCLQYQIKRCTAPCVGYVDQPQYAQQVEDTILFLEGKDDDIILRLTARMQKAADSLDYLQAAHYRNHIAQLRQLQQHQIVASPQGSLDIIGASQQHQTLCVLFLWIRAGRMIGSKPFFLHLPREVSLPEAFNEFLPQYYLNRTHQQDSPPIIATTFRMHDREWMENSLATAVQHPLKIIDEIQKPYKLWQHMAEMNAEQAIREHLAGYHAVVGQLEALQSAIAWPDVISRIECFDISHTMGEAAIGSCVVFGKEGLLKREYRRFSMTGITPGDDYAAIRQVVERRYTRLKSEDGPIPDLIFVDGGLGQLKEASAVLAGLQLTGYGLIAISKGEKRKPGLETLWIKGRRLPLHLASDDPALHLIQKIRDEAHRFAITAHRAKRHKKRVESPLQAIAGIGMKRRQSLLHYFGGLQALQQASTEEIRRVPGISEALAQLIYHSLHGK